MEEQKPFYIHPSDLILVLHNALKISTLQVNLICVGGLGL